MKLNGLSTIGVLFGIAVGYWQILTGVGFHKPIEQTSKATVYRVPLTDPSEQSTPDDDSRAQLSNTESDSDRDAGTKVTLQRKIDAMERGQNFLLAMPDYTARIDKQEVVGGNLLDEQTILIKCRHHPFSVYL